MVSGGFRWFQVVARVSLGGGSSSSSAGHITKLRRSQLECCLLVRFVSPINSFLSSSYCMLSFKVSLALHCELLNALNVLIKNVCS